MSRTRFSRSRLSHLIALAVLIVVFGCTNNESDPMMSSESMPISAAEILGNPDYPAISFGGYRHKDRRIEPTVDELKEDLRILSAMGIKLLRTYNVYLEETSRLLQAIRELKEEDPSFEMYLMMGAWIEAKNAFDATLEPIRDQESERSLGEIPRAVSLAKQYPDIVKIIAVGNEAMVHWASSYYVEPSIILAWVEHLQQLKKEGELPQDLWITSSDNFASWGGGGPEYHTEDLKAIYQAVDFISMHTYPMHDTHYNPDFWGVPDSEVSLSKLEKIERAIDRSVQHAQNQYERVVAYMKSLGIDKPVHIGESGWSTLSNEFYGPTGSKAVDEYKSGLYYQKMREWTNSKSITLFYFEAFDEPWKDAHNSEGSENHFGLINLKAQAKFAIWELVDEGIFVGLSRAGQAITKTYDGNLDSLLKEVLVPPTQAEIQERVRANTP